MTDARPGDGRGPAAVPGSPPEPPPGVPSAVPAVVHAARARLAELDDLPLAEHVAAYEDVHRLLQEALATLDER